MRTSIAGRRALVTGAGSGIGRAIAVRLAELGCRTVLVGRTQATLERTAELCRQAAPGAEALCLAADLTDEAQVRDRVIGELVRTGGLDVLVNNAGIVQSGPIADVSTQEFDRVMATNVRGPFLLMRDALPMLVASGHGEVVNICSAVAHEGYPDQGVYAASKHALLGLSKSYARENYQAGVRVHVVSPGGVLTEMIGNVRPDLVGTPMIVPDDVADAVEFLLCHRSDAVCDEIRLHRSGKAPF